MPERSPARLTAESLPPYVTADRQGTVLAVRVVPRAGATAFGGEREGALLVRLAAAPVDGAANDALITYLAACLDVPKRALALTAGERSRQKRVRIDGMPPAEVARRLHLLTP
jgi:uncharacterized protein YggU (UPF0235/DUF167 family)